MAVSDSFKTFIAERLECTGEARIKRMFGGAGVFARDRMFALIDDDVLFFKVDSSTVAAYDAEGMEAFSYPSKNGKMTMEGYRRCPDRLFDDPDAFATWALAAIAVATSGQGPAQKKQAKPRKKPLKSDSRRSRA